MPGSAGSSSIPAAAGWVRVLAVALAAGVLGIGCASRRPVVVVPPPVPVPAPATPGPASGTPATPAQPPESAGAYPPLPGTSRVYPSQDPRNQASATSPEAFPANGAGEAGPAAGMVTTVLTIPPVPAGSAPPAASTAPATAAAADPDTAAVPSGAAAEGPAPNVTTPADDPEEEANGAAVAPAGAWCVQLFASASAAIARERAQTLARHFSDPPRVEPVAGLFKVRVGHCATKDEAEVLRRRAVDLGLRDAFVVPPPAAGPGR